MTDSHDIYRYIFLHLSGEANLEEIQELRKWLNSDPQNKEIFENIAEFWEHSKIEVEAKDKDEAFSLLLSRIKPNNHRNNKVKEIRRSPSPNKKWRGFQLVAAAILFVSIAVFVVEMTADRSVEETETHKMAIVQKQNQNGQKSIIKLPDGSTVWLNAGSSISYPEIFDSVERSVALEGEAYFDIQRDEKKPFIVKVGQMNVSVLGTQFNVKAFPNDNVANVSLVSGKVKVDKHESTDKYESYFLEPGEEIKYNKESGQIEKQKFDVGFVTAWKDGILIFDNDSFDSFIRKLKRWYGVDVNVTDPPDKKWHVNGHFENESLEEVLIGVQFTHDIEFKIENKTVTLKCK